tara:strand:- start:135 stop:347 length:213 start_codon:yes stop_codon:yes gene_type:complete
MKMGLTKRQTEVLTTIRRLIDEKGYSPTYKEIGVAVGIASLSNVKWFVDTLAKRGHLVFHRGSGRSIALT